MSEYETDETKESFDVAVIGMAGRFPGARNIEEFWQNLRDGVDSITRFSDEEMERFGVDRSVLKAPDFVKSGALIPDIDLFDAAFFGYSPREAEIIDPQHRLFLECAWEALENAGYNCDAYGGMIGVYAGASLSTYLLFNILSNRIDHHDTFQQMIGNDKDFLSTRVAYEMNLKGPSMNIQTACSTSLVATHLAYQALLGYQCDIALAGGVSVQVPQRTGYYYQKGGITSPDGRCRAFDANAEGTIFGSGVGIVVLKRLAEALADGDTIHAVIKGSAINNDGSSKIGYTAPGLDGQAQVIALAQMLAGVEAETIGYIEAHGTGTALGDPVEVAALTKAFRATTDARGFCAIGSVKTNVGHLDAAAGVTGLIKTILALKHKQLPPSLHFENPNPQIDFESSPFYVNSRLKEWTAAETPLRAGVSSFGIGGTNAHLIVEEAPSLRPVTKSRPTQLVVVSAKSNTALEATTANLLDYLKRNPDVNLADAAYVLQTGRKVFNHRRAVICEDVDSAIKAIEARDPQRMFTLHHESNHQPVVFMFPGGGAQYVNMGIDLYEQESAFRESVDECSEILFNYLGYDLRDKLYPSEENEQQCAAQMKQTSLGLTALFTVEYALARLWMSWGIRPEAMIGHSLGEYAAACLAGVFSLEDALSLVYLRAKLFERLPKGSMLSVPLSETEARSLMDSRLSIAAINGPAQCVVSGPNEAIEEMAGILAERDLEFRKLQIDVAAHSGMVTPILSEFTRFVERLELHPPDIGFISNVTGTWITDAEATDPRYWERHLRQTVRFADGIQKLLEEPGRILLEVGPGQTLSTLTKLQSDSALSQFILSSMRHPYDKQNDDVMLATTLGKLWMAGAEIDWNGYYKNESRRRIPLPTYAFQRHRYWIEPGLYASSNKEASVSRKREQQDWFYVPSWKMMLTGRKKAGLAESVSDQSQGVWIVFEDSEGIGEELSRRLREEGAEVVRVEIGERKEREEYEEVMKEIEQAGKRVEGIAHLWSVSREEGEEFKRGQERGFQSLLFLAQALASCGITDSIQLLVVTNNLLGVESRDRVLPEKATILGPCKVAPQEFENLSARLVDISLSAKGAKHEQRLAEQLLDELKSKAEDEIVAYRGDNRWVQTFEPFPVTDDLEPVRAYREKGVYLLTGGMGGIGMLLASHLARIAQARLVLTHRSEFPQKDQWNVWLTSHSEDNETSRKIRKLISLEEMGAEVTIFRADVGDEEQMRSVFDRVFDQYGRIDCVIHLAGVTGEKAVNLITQVEMDEIESQFRSKVYGLYVLEKLMAERPPEMCLLFSSNASILGGLGSVTYSAANLFMDAFAISRNKTSETRWISANWDGWLTSDDTRLTASYQTSIDQYAMSADESLAAFDRLITSVRSGQVVVSTGDLDARRDIYIHRKGGSGTANADGAETEIAPHPRPALGTEYVAPQNELEQKIVTIWQEQLGIEQLGIHDNFFDLGGNSLICLKVVSQLKKVLGIDVAVVALFEGPTVSALAQLIGKQPDEQTTYSESRSRGERRREKRKTKQKAFETA